MLFHCVWVYENTVFGTLLVQKLIIFTNFTKKSPEKHLNFYYNFDYLKNKEAQGSNHLYKI